MSGATLRSSHWRSAAESEVLNKHMKKILVVQLRGYLFFGNATVIAEQVESMLTESLSNTKNKDDQNTNNISNSSKNAVESLILDFTLCNGIDSSAAETISKIFLLCRRSE
jgi:MFS superfamily sulfate permease-like transporter